MSLKKFGPNDVIVNTMRAHPSCEFFVYDSNIYYNNTPELAGANTTNVLGVPTGYANLYEYNIDRAYTNTDRIIGGQAGTTGDPGVIPSYTTLYNIDYPLGGTTGPNAHRYVLDTGRIYPFVIKDSSNQTFKVMNDEEFKNLPYGAIISGSTGSAYEIKYDTTIAPALPTFRGGGVGNARLYQYPMSASITREFMTGAAGPAASGSGQRHTCHNFSAGTVVPDSAFKCTPYHRHFWSLKNRLDFYGTLSEHYRVSSSYGDKNLQKVNLISIPSIFFGDGIVPGTVSLKWYYSGSLAGELQDTKRNGELIEVSGATANRNSVAGVVLYDEGFVVLTGSWDLNGETLIMEPGTSADNPKWIYYGAGANDGISQTNTEEKFSSASFGLSFKGASDTQVVTMFAHARRGEANFSNNPTYLQYSQSQIQLTSSQVYEENPNRLIANTVSSSFTDYSSSFKRQVYISRVGIYDENKNLIGIATLSNPILKEEDQDFAFKIRLDI